MFGHGAHPVRRLDAVGLGVGRRFLHGPRHERVGLRPGPFDLRGPGRTQAVLQRAEQRGTRGLVVRGSQPELAVVPTELSQHGHQVVGPVHRPQHAEQGAHGTPVLRLHAHGKEVPCGRREVEEEAVELLFHLFAVGPGELPAPLDVLDEVGHGGRRFARWGQFGNGTDPAVCHQPASQRPRRARVVRTATQHPGSFCHTRRVVDNSKSAGEPATSGGGGPAHGSTPEIVSRSVWPIRAAFGGRSPSGIERRGALSS